MVAVCQNTIWHKAIKVTLWNTFKAWFPLLSLSTFILWCRFIIVLNLTEWTCHCQLLHNQLQSSGRLLARCCCSLFNMVKQFSSLVVQFFSCPVPSAWGQKFWQIRVWSRRYGWYLTVILFILVLFTCEVYLNSEISGDKCLNQVFVHSVILSLNCNYGHDLMRPVPLKLKKIHFFSTKP